jgi:hypothetical protein
MPHFAPPPPPLMLLLLLLALAAAGPADGQPAISEEKLQASCPAEMAVCKARGCQPNELEGGSPQQLDRLHTASMMCEEVVPMAIVDGGRSLVVEVALEAYAAAELSVSFKTDDLTVVAAVGGARFTVLTDRVIRIEYDSNGAGAQFDDLPSTTVVNRAPQPPPQYTNHTSAADQLTLTTAYLTLKYATGAPLLPAHAAGCSTLSITVHATGVQWCPSMGVAPPSQRNLNGSFETTDCYVGWEHCLQVYNGKMQPGVVSRAGYAVINDTSAVLLSNANNSVGWPSGWRVPRPHPSGNYVDLLFFGHGVTPSKNKFPAIGPHL